MPLTPRARVLACRDDLCGGTAHQHPAARGRSVSAFGLTERMHARIRPSSCGDQCGAALADELGSSISTDTSYALSTRTSIEHSGLWEHPLCSVQSMIEAYSSNATDGCATPKSSACSCNTDAAAARTGSAEVGAEQVVVVATAVVAAARMLIARVRQAASAAVLPVLVPLAMVLLITAAIELTCWVQAITMHASARAAGDGPSSSSQGPANRPGSSVWHLQARQGIQLTDLNHYGFLCWPVPVQLAFMLCALMVSGLALVLAASQEQSRRLVQAMLPKHVIQKLSLGKTYAESFKGVSVLFSDIVSYTSLASELSPEELVDMLSDLYSGFDDLVDKHNLYKVETVGDAFMAVGGAPDHCSPAEAARKTALLALDMVQFTASFETRCKRRIQIRVGINSGDAMAAVMGRKMPRWCLVGDTVNCSSRMESSSRPGRIQVSASTASLLSQFPDLFVLEARGTVDIKGKGLMQTYWLGSA